jgi:hypothetical protein
MFKQYGYTLSWVNKEDFEGQLSMIEAREKDTILHLQTNRKN